MTAPLDLDALEAAALAAGGLRWEYGGKEYADQGGAYYVVVDERDEQVAGEYGPSQDEAKHIAAANPATVLALIERLRAAEAPPAADNVEWIVNDMGELGVRVLGRCYFCYKGESLVYEHGIHDGGEPILHRNVGKREFGETVWPYKWNLAGVRTARWTEELTYTPGLSFGSKDDPKYKWLPLPVEVPNAHS